MRFILCGILAGVAIDLTLAYIWLGCMDARDWP